MSHNLMWHEENRKEQFNCAKEIIKILDGGNNAIIVAPVKAGKKVIEEIVASLAPRDVANYHICSLNRIDCHEQLSDLKNKNILPFTLTKKNDIESLMLKLNDRISKKQITYLFFDESDYGTGDKQQAKKIIDKYSSNLYVKFVLFSATNREAEYSNFGNKCVKLSFIPADTYHGAAWFLKQGLIEEAKPFWAGCKLAQQGEEALNLLANGTKPFGIVRFATSQGCYSYSSIKKDGQFAATIMKGYGVRTVFIDSENKMKWGDVPGAEWKSYYHDFEKDPTKKVLFVICQTTTRSTEWGIHEHIAFYHDFRKNKTENTIAQAQLRAAHYEKRNEKLEILDTKIKIYGHIDTFKLEAGEISEEDFIRAEKSNKLSSRISQTDNKKIKYKYTKKIIKLEESKCLELANGDSLLRGRELVAKECGVNVEDVKMLRSSKNKEDIVNAGDNSVFRSTDGKIISYIFNGPNSTFQKSWDVSPNKYSIIIGIPELLNKDDVEFKATKSAWN